MLKTLTLGLALIATLIGRGYIEQAQADAEDVKTWEQFRAELIETRRAVRNATAALDAGSWRQRECRFQSLQPGTWTNLEEQLTAECAVRKWPVPGGYTKLYDVAMCESRWWRLANNAGRYLGLFQHSSTYWPGRVQSYDPDRWDKPLDRRWTNSRSQIVVSARMASAQGWSAWACS